MARVLIIEDYEDLADVLGRYLRMVGHEVVAISRNGLSGVEAGLTMLPSVAIIDMGLPDISGYEVASRLRLEGPASGIFLVAMTGCEAGWDPSRAFAAGFDNYLLKPLDHGALLALLAGFDAAETRYTPAPALPRELDDPEPICARSPEVFSWAN